MYVYNDENKCYLYLETKYSSHLFPLLVVI